MKRALICSLGGALLLGSGGLAAAADYDLDGVPESEESIRIATHNWSSQIAVSHVMGNLLEKLGYSVEYVPIDSQAVYEAIRLGDLHIQMEVWEGAFDASFREAIDRGGLIDAGDHDAVTREEWWYPIYMEEQCPGLPDWEALNDCADIFATPETMPDGRFLAGPVDWLKHDHERVEALGLNYQVINAGSASALWAELDSAYHREAPILMFNWTPNFVEAVYEGNFIEFPTYEPECHSDPAWGVNPDEIYDCGNPADGYLKKAAWEGMPETWPTGYTLLENVVLTNPHIAKMAAMMDIDGMEAPEAAAAWMDENEELWQGWMASVTQ